MGPKPKGKDKNAKPEPPAIDPKEIVTELDKEFFEFQLSEIEKKLNRIEGREEELRLGTLENEDKIEECKKEKKILIDEQQEVLNMKEAEKIRKREEALQLYEEFKARTQRHIKHLQEMEENYGKMVQELTDELAELEEEVRILEDYKLRKEMYLSQLQDLENEMSEAEMQQQRNLFYIEQKAEVAKHRVKKELQFKLLQLSIEFRQTTQKRIGKPSHRITQENKAIENELRLMTYDIIEYEENCIKAKEAVKKYKEENDMWLLERDKGIARVVVQMALKKALLLDRFRLLEKQKEYFPFEVQNKSLTRKLRTVTLDIERILKETEDVKQNMEKITEETNEMSEASIHLKKSSRRLNLHVRNALKIAEEARAVRLIPMGGMEEERYITNDAKIRLFKKRRDSTFRRKGKILHYLLEFLLQGQLSDDDKKFIRRSSASFDIDTISFTHIFKKAGVDREEGKEGSLIELEEEIGPYVGEGSEESLPRSVTPTTRSVKSETESAEEEAEEEIENQEQTKEKEKQKESEEAFEEELGEEEDLNDEKKSAESVN